ncbi:hypothetical protein [Mariniblastus fucicola]|uniref:Uncharacterized protein n=1 Tax=Mariniblastus fucicola TaxID=980251 RepID=A0A5B9PBQ5_9BACT|nr:hypothetical protein [Mariniblastus fucicola]QEG22909.1 hypothetical protein MFFC18_27970 [Mariniblastus fucicola]
MSPIAKLVSLVALIVTVAPSLLYFFGVLSLDAMKWIALAGTIAWFVSTPMWMGRKQTG